MTFSIADSLWVFLAAILVFFMNLGFACVEAGFARAKNTVNILSKNFIVFTVSSLGFLLLGWGLMFGGDGPVLGTEHLFILGSQDLSFYDDTLTASVPFWGKFFFQLVFCGTAATIVSGAVAERVKYISFILFSFVLTLVIYPIVGHWIWGGGWLAGLGFLDFAGDTAVHSLGGWAALAGAVILGPRIGKYGRDGRPQAIPGHSMSLAVIGLFVLWLGWFGFNPGSTMSFQSPEDVFHILMTTNTAAIAAVLTSTAASWAVMGKPDLGMTVNGCLAGLVGITGGCAYVSVASSLLIGALAGVLVVFAVLFFDRIHVDDPVGATSVHLCCGVFGTLCIGLFAQEGVTTLSVRNGLFFGGGTSLLLTQLIGVLAVGAFAMGASALVWLVLKHTVGIRVTAQEGDPRAGHRRARQRRIPGLLPRRRLPLRLRGHGRPRRLQGCGRAGGPLRKPPGQDHQGHHPGQPEPLRPASGRPGGPWHHRHHRDQRVRLRRTEGPRDLFPRQPRQLPPAPQAEDRHRDLQDPHGDPGQDRAGYPVHRACRGREDLSLRRGGRGQDPHRRARL